MKDLTIEITDRCSLNCLHCSTNASPKGAIFLREKQLLKYLQDFSDFDHIRFSGGEPFEHLLIEELAKKVKQKNKELEILTSGVFYESSIPNSLLKDIKSYLDRMIFSIYGPEKIHNKITRHNSFSLLGESVDRAIKQKIPIYFQTVAMKSNQQEIENIIKYIHNKKPKTDYCNLGLHILRFIKQGRATQSDEALKRQKLDNLILDAAELSEKYNLKVSFGCSLKEENCVQGNGKAVITAQGEKTTCSALKYGSKQEPYACKDRW
jgi:MoaA/NifB/PqqE/SkfB family radical SAM enzyme